MSRIASPVDFTGAYLWLFAMFCAWTDGVTAPLAETFVPSLESVVAEDGPAHGMVGATFAVNGSGVVITVDGLAYRDVAGYDWNDADVTAVLTGALATGNARLGETADGFQIDWASPPEALRLTTLGTFGSAPYGVVSSRPQRLLDTSKSARQRGRWSHLRTEVRRQTGVLGQQ